MASRVKNIQLLEKCKRFIVENPNTQSMDLIIQDALITSSQQISHDIDRGVPLAWMRGTYDNLFTRYACEVSAATQASPGVFTADSLDEDVTGHGFTDKDLVYGMAFGDDSMDELNERFYRLNYASSTTFSLLNVDGQYAVSTSSMDAWDTGGYFYHCGLILPSSTIKPTSGNVWEIWDIKDIYKVTVDSIPIDSITEEEAVSSVHYMRPGGMPERWAYWRNDYQGFGSTEHYLRFWPPTNQRYNIRIFFEKTYPDLSFKETAYPPHPPEIHDCIWRRALSLLATVAEKQKRESKSGERMIGQIEVLYANHWKAEAAKDEIFIRDFSRKLIGSKVSSRGFSA